ncbi:MAG: recombination protein RecR [Clostridia bacterium]|nr:recombination protein RecR [Clostridia bacterium]
MEPTGVEPIKTLAMRLSGFPGIGMKTALRLAYHVLEMSEESARGLAEAIINAKEKIHLCKRCGAYTDSELCSVCSDKTRDHSLVCVVAEPKDVLSMERMREYKGVYHVLGGTISPIDGVGPNDLRIKELSQRVDDEHILEVVIATNPDVEGEATSSYIVRLLKPKGIRITRIAHGIPMGGNLEYIDEMTLYKAIEGRRDI